MKLTVNGQPRDTEASTVGHLVVELGLPPEAALVELNGLALLRSEWDAATLGDGDRIEIIRLVAGG